MKHAGRSACALVLCAALMGCGGGGHEDPHASHQAHEADRQVLADGSHWQANAETTEGVRGMQALVEDYPTNGLIGDQLRDSLDARMAMIFERCTMKGEAHEVLHHYLLPLQGLIHRLPGGSSSAQLDSLRQHLQHYDEVFY